MTLKQVNAAIEQYGLALAKGRGYFYFYSTDARSVAELGGAEGLYGTPRLSGYSLEFIVETAKTIYTTAMSAGK